MGDHGSVHLTGMHQNPNHQPVMMLIGNKCDMIAHRQVSEQQGRDLADQWGLLFAETSAKVENQNVHQVFSQIAEKIYDSILSGEVQPNEHNGIRQYGIQQYGVIDNKVTLTPSGRWNQSFCCFQ